MGQLTSADVSYQMVGLFVYKNVMVFFTTHLSVNFSQIKKDRELGDPVYKTASLTWEFQVKAQRVHPSNNFL